MLAKTLEIPAGDHPTFIKVARGELSVAKLPSLVSDSLPIGKTVSIPGNLPRALTPFIGREPELAALAQLLRDPHCSLLTIVGPGGIGKTRLAIEAGHHSKELFPDGVWIISLASLNSPAMIIPAIADGVGFKFQDPTNLQGQLLRYLRPLKSLLVLDNAEHLLDGVAVFTEIMNECHLTKLLVTSRERLNLLSEWVFEIQGLPVPANDQANQFDAYSAVALFIQSAKRTQSSFAIRVDERQWVLEICRVMEGMPLGIELSAAWVGMLSLKEIASEIESNLFFPALPMRDIPERHRSLQATLDHSWKLLNAEEKLILSRLSVFHGSFSRKAAQEICGASLAILSSLKNKSLLQRTNQDDYGLHEIIRQYASLKLAEQAEENERIKDRHAMYFVQYLADCEAALQGSRQIETFDNMAAVIDNLSQGWQYMVTHCRPNTGNRDTFPAALLHSALFSISLFYEMRCRSLEAITLFNDSVEYLNGIRSEFEGTEDATGFRSVIGHITAYLGLHHYYIAEYEKVRVYLEESLKWLDNDQSRVEEAQAQVMLASAEDIFGQLHESATLLEQSREVFRVKGEDWWYALSTTNLASSYMSIGKYHDSEALYQEALRLIKHGNLRLEVPARNGYAVLLYFQNDFSKAEQILLESLQLTYRLGDNRQTAYCLSYLGRVALATHRVELAEKYLQKGVDILQELGQTYDLAIMCVHLGKDFAAKPDLLAARHQFRQVIKLGQALNKFHLVYYGLVNIASTFVTEGHTSKALEIFLLLRRCPVEYVRMQADYDQLQADLQEALPEGGMETALKQVEGKISLDDARADVLAYVHDTS